MDRSSGDAPENRASGPRPGRAGTGADERQRRLEQALRENLRRRKAQARGRATDADRGPGDTKGPNAE
jgi:hypothetical protein